MGVREPMNLFLDYQNWMFSGITPAWEDGALRWEIAFSGEGSSLVMAYAGTVIAGDWLAFSGNFSMIDGNLDGVQATLDGEGQGVTSITQGQDFTFARLDLDGGEEVALKWVDSFGDPINFSALTGWFGDPGVPAVSFNCECDDENPSRTLLEMRTDLMRRLGFSTMTANPPPGMPELLDSFLQGAQRSLYRQYSVLRTQRFFTWDMEAGVRFYDLDANADTCTKKLDARRITWAGLSIGDDEWRPLTCGIPPECYQSATEQGIPYRYEIRQCIEVWPAPDVSTYRLRIKGDFGLERFTEDGDKCTVDDEAVFLFALARAKAHYSQPDAANYQTDAINYIKSLTSGAHQTRKYVPGEPAPENLPMPRWVRKPA